MTIKDYQDYVAMRSQDYVDADYLVIAINEEAGEIAGWYKKYVLRGNVTGKYTRDDLKGELGDLLFYLTRMANIHGWDLTDVMEHNKTKLDERVERKMRQIV